ncbi:hypothetical protein V5799_014096 [Amblyomma americanum]|uniref:Secreted protein n=1 Tax=Amblyomma americanum TaxID=6943 RepID=A0AAQ4E411_AMBAM
MNVWSFLARTLVLKCLVTVKIKTINISLFLDHNICVLVFLDFSPCFPQFCHFRLCQDSSECYEEGTRTP